MKDKIIKIVGFGMEPERAELIAQQVLDLFAVSGSICDRCNGQGWYSEHAASYLHDEDGSCNGNCPIQVQCEKCYATGVIFNEQLDNKQIDHSSNDELPDDIF